MHRRDPVVCRILLSGSVLVHAEEEEVRKIMEEMTDAICDNDDDGCPPAMRLSPKLLLSSFIQVIQKEGGIEE